VKLSDLKNRNSEMGNENSTGISKQFSKSNLKLQLSTRCKIELDEEEEDLLPVDFPKKIFLLLGAGESGKYTIYKQLKKYLKNMDYSTEEKQLYRSIIQENIYKITYKFLRWCSKQNFDIDNLGDG
jgi:hypothetical protein